MALDPEDIKALGGGRLVTAEALRKELRRIEGRAASLRKRLAEAEEREGQYGTPAQQRRLLRALARYFPLFFTASSVTLAALDAGGSLNPLDPKMYGGDAADLFGALEDLLGSRWTECPQDAADALNGRAFHVELVLSFLANDADVRLGWGLMRLELPGQKRAESCYMFAVTSSEVRSIRNIEPKRRRAKRRAR